ncbi:MAG: BMP family ABC transporter substrate-binding protein [Ruminococcaceae bacterium]|nr:BMP family ABC transporter substrate-binding protein [Oscillospiraceae bacterium]
MKKFLALILVAVMVLALAACGTPAKPTQPEKPAGSAAPAGEATGAPSGEMSLNEQIRASVEAPIDTAKAKAANDGGKFKVGVILLHNEQIGYDAAHIDGLKGAFEKLGIKEDQVTWKYNIPEDETCHDAAVDLAEAGCNIIFANSFGHESYLMQAAEEYPDVLFCHASGQSAATSKLTNFCNYFTKVFESRYVSGVVAGMKLKEMMDDGKVKDPYVGYVGAYPYAEVVSGYTAFFLGVKSIVPEAHMDVTFTNSWADMTAESEAANALMAKGCSIISQHADTTGAPTAVQAALDSGKDVYCVGYNVDMLAAAPKAALTSAQNNWVMAYASILDNAMQGKPLPRNTAFGYENEGVQISKLGPSCAKGTDEKVAEVVKAISEGKLRVFDTKSFTVDGKELTSYDKSYGFDGVELIWDGYFHESELLSAPLFDIAVDGIKKLN